MCDSQIVDKLIERDESALQEISDKFGRLCMQIAYNILGNLEEAEECVNDAYLNVWNSIPPARPDNFKAFLCTITRNSSLDRLKYNSAQKRMTNDLIPLSDVENTVGEACDYQELGEIMDKFLRTEKREARIIFVRRYWLMEPISEIAKRFGFSESKVKSMLARTRAKLEKVLKKEGYTL